MKSRASNFRPPRVFVILVIVGVLLHILYLLLRTMEIGNFGQPSDIGGGLIPLFGYLLLGAGLMGLFVDFIRGRTKQRDL